MKCIRRSQRNKMEGLIPNWESVEGLTLEVVTDGYNKDLIYKYNGNELMKITAYAHGYSSIRRINNTTAFLLGLCSHLNGLDTDAMFDALYYKCNPYIPNLYYKDRSKGLKPIAFKAFVNKLIKRYTDFGYARYHSFNKQMIQVFIDAIGLEKPENLNTIEALQEYNTQFLMKCITRPAMEMVTRLALDFSSGDFVFNYGMTKVKTRTSTIFLDCGSDDLRVNLSSLGLELYETDRYSNGQRFLAFNRDTEVIHRNQIYLKTELQLVTCQECGQEVVERELTDTGCVICDERASQIYSYNTKVPEILKYKPTYKPSSKTPILYLGTELEYNCESDVKADSIYANRSLKGHAILKHDGSISNGFEIVTCPATLSIHLDEFKPFFKDLKSKSSLAKHHTTGMHIHISKKYLSSLAIGKMTLFLNKLDNKKFIEKIGGRDLNNYCKQDNYRTISYHLKNSGDRYNTLNLRNVHTLELRFFSTPETYEEFAYKMEFAEALAKYCNPCTVALNAYEQTDYKHFIAWALKQKHSYPNLVTKLKTL